MPETSLQLASEVQQAFVANECQVRVQNYRVACIVALIFMPAGASLDYLVYPEHLGSFFGLRVLCSVLLFFLWWAIKTPLGTKYSPVMALVLPGLPTFFISWMIYATEGAESSYYAGLNLVLLGAAILLRWTLRTSILVCLEVLVMYLVACWMHTSFHPKPTPFEASTVYSNIYFISVTGIFVVVSSFFYNRLRYSEFALRYELDKNRHTLAENNQKLLELGQVKDRFFANISHELRTPLTLLISPLEILIFQKGSLLTPEHKTLLQTMHTNAMRLLKMINDLLDLVRLESGRMEVKPEPIELQEFTKSLGNATRQLAESKQLQLQLEVAPDLTSVLTDRDKLEKISLNLLFNAIKFTNPGGRVELTARKEDDQLVLAVKDTGVGISPKHLPFVFDRFWQADNSSKRKFKGVGIGLSLVKELTEIQGGRAAVESEEGKGTTFTIRLPYVKADAAGSIVETHANGEPVPARREPNGLENHSEEWLTHLYRRAEFFGAPASDHSSVPDADSASSTFAVERNKKSTVLIADDEPGMTRFIKSQIQSHYGIIEAIDGREAVEKVLQHLPDVILLDMNMPEKDGLQVCRELRDHSSTEKIPIIILTARADEETKLAALSAGANDFLPKPFSVAELHVRLKNLVIAHEYQEELTRQNHTLTQTIDQLKQTESELVQTAKMASLGRMSAGIIHEINNPLNFARTGLYTLRVKGDHLPSQHQREFAEIIGDIEDGLTRVRDIVLDLRTFTHPDTGQVDCVDVSEAVGSALRFLSYEWLGKVQMDVQLPKAQAVRANKNRLVQILLNLLQNAMDAMKKKQFVSEAPAVRITGEVTDDKSTIVIHDNGEGIDPAHLDKIFDPFFTTKEVGDGMGLGLSICYRLVQQQGGQILVRSERGKFTEFTLEFPAAQLN